MGRVRDGEEVKGSTGSRQEKEGGDEGVWQRGGVDYHNVFGCFRGTATLRTFTRTLIFHKHSEDDT